MWAPCVLVLGAYVRLLISKAATIDSRRTSFSLSPTAAFLTGRHGAWRVARQLHVSVASPLRLRFLRLRANPFVKTGYLQQWSQCEAAHQEIETAPSQYP